MTDEPFYSPTYKPAPARVAKRGELLFEFLRGSDRAPLSCELRFHGESYGWEALFFRRGELALSRGAFVTKGLAVQWATLGAGSDGGERMNGGGMDNWSKLGRYDKSCKRATFVSDLDPRLRFFG